jgi:hypothetical protein
VDKFLDSPAVIFLVLMIPLILCLFFMFADGVSQRQAILDCIEATKEVAECVEMWSE